mgnify:FL=1
MTPRRSFSRLSWGVLWDTAGRDAIGPIFRGHHDFETPAQPYDGEPTRPLLFRSRRHAREWCAKTHRQYASPCPAWRWRPVRVRETLRVVGR